VPTFDRGMSVHCLGSLPLTAGVLVQRDMSAEEACELGRRAIYHATFRDAVSGGTVSGAHHRQLIIPTASF
jgi:20S proteasome alpha/beta subunit